MDDREDVKRAFRRVDVHNTGKSSKADCLALFSTICGDWSDNDLEDLFNSAEVDADGFLKYDELIEWLYSVDDVVVRHQRQCADTDEKCRDEKDNGSSHVIGEGKLEPDSSETESDSDETEYDSAETESFSKGTESEGDATDRAEPDNKLAVECHTLEAVSETDVQNEVVAEARPAHSNRMLTWLESAPRSETWGGPRGNSLVPWSYWSKILHTRFLTLEELDAHIVQHCVYQDAVMNIISMMSAKNLTLNHVNGIQALENMTGNDGLLPPALECMLGRGVDAKLDKNDICKGLGYYHFNRISAGTMSNAPNFNLNHRSPLMFFIDPHVLSTHHFIACKGNTAKETAERTPGKLHSRMTKSDALEEALRAVRKLDEMLQHGVDNIPFNNEIAVFQGVESRFVYTHVAAIEGSGVLSDKSPFAQRVFKVRPATSRYEAGQEAAISDSLSTEN